MARRTTPELIRGVRQLGVAVGRSRTAISDNWIGHPEWPYGPGPWPVSLVPQMQAWAERTLSIDPAKKSPNVNARGSANADVKRLAALSRIATEQTRQRTEQLRQADLLKEVHRVDECKLRRTRQIQTLKNRLFGELPGLPLPEEHRTIVQEWLMGLVTEFAGGGGD